LSTTPCQSSRCAARIEHGADIAVESDHRSSATDMAIWLAVAIIDSQVRKRRTNSPTMSAPCDSYHGAVLRMRWRNRPHHRLAAFWLCAILTAMADERLPDADRHGKRSACG
jgi:hypothetical protein